MTEVMNQVDASHRNVAMVFENMPCIQTKPYRKIASPLRSHLYKQDNETIDREVRRVTSLLRVTVCGSFAPSDK